MFLQRLLTMFTNRNSSNNEIRDLTLKIKESSGDSTLVSDIEAILAANEIGLAIISLRTAVDELDEVSINVVEALRKFGTATRG